MRSGSILFIPNTQRLRRKNKFSKILSMFNPLSFFKKQSPKETAKLLKDFLLKMEKLSDHEKNMVANMLRMQMKGKLGSKEIEHAFHELESQLKDEMTAEELIALRKAFLSLV